MKIIIISIALLFLAHASLQQDDLLSQIKKLQQTQRPSNLDELSETICGCDEIIPTECRQKQDESTLKRLTRSIEQPITTLWEKIKWVAQDEPTQEQQNQNLTQQSSCQTERLIKCNNPTETIKIVKADMSNSDKNKCPASNTTVDTNKNDCESTRIQSTELAQQLCDNKNECRISLDKNGFEDICKCFTQKYLEVSYMCISNTKTKTTRSSRNKRQLGRLGRLGNLNRRPGFYGGLFGGLALQTPLDVYDYLALSGYGIGFPRFGINQRFPIVV